jgi:hypothetical protein
VALIYRCAYTAVVMHGAKTTWRFLSGIGKRSWKLVMLVQGILYVAGGIWFGVHDASSPAVRILSSSDTSLMVALSVFVILGAIKFPRGISHSVSLICVGSRGNLEEL